VYTTLRFLRRSGDAPAMAAVHIETCSTDRAGLCGRSNSYIYLVRTATCDKTHYFSPRGTSCGSLPRASLGCAVNAFVG